MKANTFQASTALNGFLVFGEFLLRERRSTLDPKCSVHHPRLVIKLGSIMEIQIMLIEMKFYSANVYFTLLCAQVQCGSKGVDNVLFICKMF